MNNDSRENLSSFMDGEVDKAAASFLVRRLAGDTQLRETWSRYHVIRDCLRQQDGKIIESDLSIRVRQLIDEEDSTSSSADRQNSWFKPVAGVAIAATVAFMAVLAVGPGQQAVPGAGFEEGTAGTAKSEPFISPNIGNAVPATQPVNLSGQNVSQQEKAKAYLLRHYQVTGDGAGQGFVSLVPIVASQDKISSADEQESSEPVQEAVTP